MFSTNYLRRVNNNGNKSKSTFVNLQKEEEEDRELLELLEGKRKNEFFYYLNLSVFDFI